ncbi:MAG: M28 family peptidase, partial [Luteimonas sp.]|nr:M28 family peptidase [Luteimonas sp.]
VVGVLQLDMTNYGAGSTFAMRLMTDNSNPTLQNFVTRLFDAYLAPMGLTRGTDTCGYACSDHASWTAAGYPAAMMAEPTFFTRLHTTTDTLAYMGNSAAVSVNFARLGLAFVGELGKTHVLRRRNGSQPLAPAATASPVPPAAMAPVPATRLPIQRRAWTPVPRLSTSLRSRYDP